MDEEKKDKKRRKTTSKEKDVVAKETKKETKTVKKTTKPKKTKETKVLEKVAKPKETKEIKVLEKTAEPKKTKEIKVLEKTAKPKETKEIKVLEKTAEPKKVKETKVLEKAAKPKAVKETEKSIVIKKEVKEETLLNKEDQTNYNFLCKVIRIFVKIGRIVLMIFVPFIFLFMILIPIIFKNFEISGNVIKFDDVNVIVNGEEVTVKIGDNINVLKANEKELDNITTFLTNNTNGSIITFVELSLFLLAIVIVLNIYLLMYVEKLFGNFASKKTPFIEENTKYIFKIAIFMCALKFISICLNIADLNIINVSTISIIEIMIVFVVYYVFKYAVKLQSKSIDKIYD